MAIGSIQINSNTLLKLLIRRGLNSERLNVILSEGELGYTTDSKKLYIGDGSSYGGVQITGSKFLGSANSVTSFAPADPLDMAFDADNKISYYLSSGDGSQISDWVAFGGLYTGGADGTITVNSDGTIQLGNVSGQSITRDSNSRITLASTIYTDNISTQTASGYLTLPGRLTIGNIAYTFPDSGAANNYLKLNSSGQLTWEAIGSTANVFVNSEVMPVGTIVPYSSTVLPSNNKFLYCDGSYKLNTQYPTLCTLLGTSFGALSTSGGSTYFKLPDMRGKTPIGYTTSTVYDLSGTGYTVTFATSGGVVRTTLTEEHIPQHFHYVATGTYNGDGTSLSATNALLRNSTFGTDTEYELRGYAGTADVGKTSTYGFASPTPISSLQPYLALNYIIKAIADSVASSTITVGAGLTALNIDTSTTVSVISPLSSNYRVGLTTIGAPGALGYINVDNTGRVTSFDSSSAGTTATSQPQNTVVAHQQSFINFLKTPIEVANDTITVSQPTWCGPVVVFPRIKNVNGVNTAAAAIPSIAKNAIVDVFINEHNPSDERAIYAALNTSLMNSSTAAVTRGSTEYLLGYVRPTVDTYREAPCIAQFTLPLSAHPTNGTISFAIRGLNLTGTYSVRVVGWTL